MKTLPFKHSGLGSLGVELEIQLINPITYDLSGAAKDLMRHIQDSPFLERIKPEITQSMIEINSSIHQSPQTLLTELTEIRDFLLDQAHALNIQFCGGGTHPFQKWSLRKIFPTKRFKNLSRQFRYLSKNSTVFGLHIHVGCPSGEDALYLTHALARYVPHFIALSGSSPFYQGVDTGYCSSRLNTFTGFPSSGVVPYLTNWKDFSTYFYKMRNLGIVHTMKDFYWDVRPKPEFGTVEIRVCDMPLTIEKVTSLAAYLQALSLYLLEEKPVKVSHDLYYLYGHNRFQACRYGFDGDIIDANSSERRAVSDDILATFNHLKKYAERFDTMPFLLALINDTFKKHNDTVTIRQLLKQVGSLSKLVHEQCIVWAKK